MHTPLDAGIFRAFGFVVLRSCLTPDEVAALDAAYRRVMATAESYDYFGSGGTKLALHVMDAEPVLAHFAVHPKIIGAMQAFWNAAPLMLTSDLWSNLDATPWHSDGIPGRRGVTMKVTTYFDPMTGTQGALRVIPGSHHREFCMAILNRVGVWDQGRPRVRLEQDDVPGQVAVDMNPGDVVVWDNRMWHSAPRRADGKPRRGLFNEYVPDPGDECTSIADLQQTMSDFYTDKRPFLYGKAFLANGGAVAEHMASRLEQLSGKRVRE